MKLLSTFLAICFLASVQAQTLDIRAVSQAVKNAKPGSEIVIKNGIYHDIELIIHGTGTSEKPIIVRAETLGQVVLSGKSNLRLAGDFVEVHGLVFKDGYTPSSTVIEFRTGRDVANNCRVTQCAILWYNQPDRTKGDTWVYLYGRNNRFDHNVLEGKTNIGVTLIVELNEEKHRENHHRIDHNYFGKRPNFGSNGAETIRVGTSTWAHFSSRTVFERNFFEQCDGEVEIISLKASDNIVRNNTFYESVGVVALRHGDRNLIEGNAFFGNNKPFSGGIRIVNAGHTVRNNYLEGLTGSRFFSPLAVMNSVPNSLPNRYHQVKDVQIYGNVWNNCVQLEFGTGSNNELSETPENVSFRNNTIINLSSPTPFVLLDDMSGITFRDNTFRTSDGKFTHRGFTQNSRATATNVATNAVRREETGPSWYDKNSTKKTLPAQTFTTIRPGQNTLVDAVKRSIENAVIELEEGTYWIDEMMEINHTLTIRAKAGTKTRPVLRYNGSRNRQFFFVLSSDVNFTLEGIWIDGIVEPGKGQSAGGVSPAQVMHSTYSATFRNCRFSNFNESSYSAFRTQKGTMADVLRFENCSFDHISGAAIFLGAETDNRGTYNAEEIYVINCKFFNILGAGVTCIVAVRTKARQAHNFT